jgi:rhodanese-related sulfurtransferase
VDDVANLDLAYAPPFSSAMDHVIHCANIIRNKLDGVKSITPLDFKTRIKDDILILDVRSEKEFQARKIDSKNVINIPIKELRESLDRIPKDKEVIVSCAIGTRAYEAVRILMNRGYENVRFLDGALATWLDEV